MPLLITGIVSLDVDAGVVLSLDAAVDDGDGDFPFAVGGEMLALWLCGERLEIEAGLLPPLCLPLLLLSLLPACS
jgi:hypothetical protein